MYSCTSIIQVHCFAIGVLMIEQEEWTELKGWKGHIKETME